MKAEVLICSLALAGCAQSQIFAPESAPEYMTERATPLYVHGPLQFERPMNLPSQTFVQLLRQESGYSFVRLDETTSGYVANEDLRPAPPSPPAVLAKELFPEAELNTPDPDFTLPVEELPKPKFPEGPGQ